MARKKRKVRTSIGGLDNTIYMMVQPDFIVPKGAPTSLVRDASISQASLTIQLCSDTLDAGGLGQSFKNSVDEYLVASAPLPPVVFPGGSPKVLPPQVPF
tara:strand:- start:435 stop:734 length:300 start_codon:yes stop_codon:yes gene_type:complete